MFQNELNSDEIHSYCDNFPDIKAHNKEIQYYLNKQSLNFYELVSILEQLVAEQLPNDFDSNYYYQMNIFWTLANNKLKVFLSILEGH